MSSRADCFCSQPFYREFSYYSVYYEIKPIFSVFCALEYNDLCKPADTPERNTALV